MKYEVEQKFRLKEGHADIERRLSDLGVSLNKDQRQVDQYFAHPCRDFAKTDEALRIRAAGEHNWITYKGPKVDQSTKTRKEIELTLPDGDEGRDGFGELLEALGFTRVAEVQKQRRSGQASWEGAEVEVALDSVEGLGTFVEIELAVPESQMDHAKARLKSLAEKLGLSDSERRSYLELLLTQKP